MTNPREALREPVNSGRSSNPLSIQEAEAFFTEGSDARHGTRIDVPGVGLMSIAPGRDYAAGEVPEPLRSLVDGRMDVEITPVGVAMLEEMASADPEPPPSGLYGEPWGFGVDSLDQVRIFDSEGHLICRVASQSKREALEWGERICASVNFCSGLPEFDLAVAKPIAASLKAGVR